MSLLNTKTPLSFSIALVALLLTVLASSTQLQFGLVGQLNEQTTKDFEILKSSKLDEDFTCGALNKRVPQNVNNFTNLSDVETLTTLTTLITVEDVKFICTIIQYLCVVASLVGLLPLFYRVFIMLYSKNIRKRRLISSLIHISAGTLLLFTSQFACMVYVFNPTNQELFYKWSVVSSVLCLINSSFSLPLLVYLYPKLPTFTRLMMAGQLAAIGLPLLFLDVFYFENTYVKWFVAYTYLFFMIWYSIIGISDLIWTFPDTIKEIFGLNSKSKTRADVKHEKYDKYHTWMYFTILWQILTGKKNKNSVNLKGLLQNRGLRLFPVFLSKTLMVRFNTGGAAVIFMIWFEKIWRHLGTVPQETGTWDDLSLSFMSLLVFGYLINAAAVFALTIAVREYKQTSSAIFLYQMYAGYLPTVYYFATGIATVIDKDIGLVAYFCAQF